MTRIGEVPKVRTGAVPLAYLAFLPRLVRVAQEHGYALAVHGSLARDFDLIAVPWVEKASPPETLAGAIRDACGGFYDEGEDYPVDKPHGRQAWVINLGGGPYIDLSIMPPRETKSLAEYEGEETTREG